MNISTMVGRVDERRRIAHALARASELSSLVIVSGEAGIGKSALFGSSVEEARASAATVLVSRPARAEESFAYSALADLLDGVSGAALDALSAPARRALDFALRRADDPPPDFDAGAVAFAAAQLLATLAAPVVLAIDDVQWVDASSAAVVDFVLRRVPAAGMFVLAAWRSGTSSRCTFVSRPPDALACETIALGPVGVAELHHIIRERAGIVPTRPALVGIAEMSGGNPLFAIELARHTAGSRVGQPVGQATGAAPMPPTLRDSLRRRLSSLSDDARATLLVVAALGRPSLAQVSELVAAEDLERVEADGAIVIRDGRVEFSHPLLAAEIYASTPTMTRIAMHARLAASMGSLEERAHHLALATSKPDAAVASEIDAAAVAAANRGAPHAAADLGEAAVRLTPAADPNLWRRQVALAEHRFRAGDAALARRGLEEALDSIDDTALRARSMLLLAEIAFESDTPSVAIGYATRAVRDAPTPALEAEARVTLARVYYDDFSQACEHAREARAIVEREPSLPADIVAAAELTAATTAFLAGAGLDRAAYERAADIEATSARRPRLADSARAALAADLKYADQLDDARIALLALHEESLGSGDESSRPFALSHLPQLELFTGSWDVAEAWANEHLMLAEATRQHGQIVQARFNLAMIAAHRGDLEPARAHALHDLEVAIAANDRWTIAALTALLGFVEWSDGDAVGALAHLRRSFVEREAMGLREPGRSRFLGDHIETLIACDEIDEARDLIALVYDRSVAVGRPSGISAAQRGSGLLLARDGDQSGAQDAFAAALAALDGVPLPFERARTLLAQGQALRRGKARRAAREVLAAAHDEFTRLGAQLWAARASNEIDRVGGRVSTSLELTDTERRVAELAATGASTRAIAAAAYISVKTVEANLTRIYRKLGVTSRAELAALMADGRRG